METDIDTIDFKTGLDDLQMAFCRHKAQGKNPTLAYEAAQRDAGMPINRSQSAQMGFHLMKDPMIQNYLSIIREQIEKHCVTTQAEILALLSEAIYTPIADIDEHHPLCQERTITTKVLKDGSRVETETFKMIPKMEAIKQFSRMQGFDAPIQVEHKAAGGVMLVPFAANVDDWAANVVDDQKKLMADAIDI